MFGSSMFRNDPFFNQNSDIMSDFDRMERRMQNMMQGLGGPMGSGMPSLTASPNARDNHGRRSGRELGAFGGRNMFGDMFGNMDAMMSQMQQNPNSHFSSSSRVVSYSSNGQGPPKIYEATSSTTQGPGGVRQTSQSERNSETGVDRMAVGHHIHDRGHVVERSRNRRTKEQEENQEFLNMDEDEKDAFHEEFKRKSRMTGGGGRDIGYGGGGGGGNNHQRRPPPRAIDSAEYHRNNLDNRNRGRDRDGRKVQINSRAEEFR